MADVCGEIAAALRGQFQGELLQPGEPGYREARVVWNAMVARSPGLIARCRDAADVQKIVRSAAALGALTAVRCGGHSLAGFSTCEGGLVVDLSLMRALTVDASTRVATFSGGCLLGNVDTATQQFGLAFPSGVVSHTGAAGLILGGGFGWLTRLHGLSCDNVESFTLITADGEILKANSKNYSDLWWALRGGGGNFGVVTEFEVTLHPISSLVLARGVCHGERAVETLRFWRDFMTDAPWELKWNLSLVPPPAERRSSGVPASLTQTLVWFGDLEQGTQYMQKILARVGSEGNSVDTISYLALQRMADHEFPHGRRYYTKSGYLDVLDDETIVKLLGAVPCMPSPRTQIEIAYLGAAATRLGSADTAFGDRHLPFVINILADWADAADDAANVGWAKQLFTSLTKLQPGAYVNFMSADEQNRVADSYHSTWKRLVDVKTRYDPHNFFRLNHNIAPRRLTIA